MTKKETRGSPEEKENFRRNSSPELGVGGEGVQQIDNNEGEEGGVWR